MKTIYRFLYTKDNKRGYFNLLILALVTNILLVLSPIVQKKLIQSISEGSFLKEEILSFLIIGFSLILVSFLEIYVLNKAKIIVQKNISLDLLESLSIKESSVIQTRGSGAFMSSVFGDAEQISTQLLGKNLFFGVINIVTCLVILFITYRWMKIFPLLIIVSYVIAIFGVKIIQKKRSYHYDKLREEIFKLNPIMLETIENRKTIMNNSNFNTRKEEINDKIDLRDQSFQKSLTLAGLGNGFIDSVKQIFLVIFFIISMYQIIDGRLEISSFIAITAYFQSVYLPLYFIKTINDSKTNIELLYNRNKSSFDAKPNLLLANNYEVFMKDVSLDYKDRKIIDHINLNIDKVYGIVGLSGEGKSSLFDLLLGEAMPTDGKVIVGGHRVDEYDLNLRLSMFKYYPQENEIFDDDLRYNITLGKDPLSAYRFDQRQREIFESLLEIKSGQNIVSVKDRDIIIHTLKMSRTDYDEAEFWDKLVNNLQLIDSDAIKELSLIIASHNYYVEEDYSRLVSEFNLTHLEGRKFGQRGKTISGGEKNKICLARMLLLKSNVPFLIDEPFTSVDLISESKDAKVLKSYLEGKRGLIVSHKIDLLAKLTDEIIVIYNGSIEAVGSHKSLLDESKIYRDLYEEYLRKNKEYISYQ